MTVVNTTIQGIYTIPPRRGASDVQVLDPRVAFARASTPNYVDALGNTVAAATNEPRFDHDATTRVLKGLLIESGDNALVTPVTDYFDDADEYTIYVKGEVNGSISSTRQVLNITDNSANADERVAFQISDPSGDVLQFLIVVGGSATTLTLSPALGDGSVFSAAVRVKASDIAASYNGGAVVTDATVATLPTITHLTLGSIIKSSVYSGHLNGWIKHWGILPYAASNAELQSLSNL